MSLDPQAELLAVVLPVPDRSCTLFSFTREKDWREQQAAHKSVGDARSPADPVTSPIDPGNSECTEEERVAVEQLAQLRRIRDLCVEESVEDCSCATETSSFNYNDQMAAIPPLHASDPSDDSNAPPPSVVCDAVTGNRKQEQHKRNYVFQFQSSRATLDGHKGEEHTEQPQALPSRSVDANMVYVKPDDVDFNDDGRRISRSRLLTELYQDRSTQFRHRKVQKRRRNS